MAVTLNTTLKNIELAKNPIPVELETDNYIPTVGEYANLHITIDTQGNAANDTLRIGAVTFTTKTAPAQDGLDIPRGDNYGTLNEWVEAITEYINYNAYLTRYYRIWSSTNNIYFEAIETGYVSDLRLYASGSPVDATEVSYDTGADEERDTTLKMLLYLHVFKEQRVDFTSQNYDYYELVKSWELEPLDDSTNTFFINGALKPYFSKDILPDFGLSAISKNENLLLKYYLRYSEKYGTPVAQQEITKTGIYYALNGGMKHKDYLENVFLDDIITGTSAKFLTWHPLTKYLTKQQQDYLYFINVEGDATIRVQITGVFADGSTQNNLDTISTSSQYDAYIIPVGYDYVNAFSWNDELVSYQIHLYKQAFPDNIIRTETRTYKIIQDSPLMAKYFLFKNSLGAFESICFTGERTKGIEVDKQSSQKILQFDDPVTDHQTTTSFSRYTQADKVYTGFKTQADLDHFIEFLKSEEVYEQTSDHYQPVTVESNKVVLYQEQQFINSASVSIKYNSETNYSNA